METFATIEAFLSITEEDIDNYIYHIFTTKGNRDAVRACMKLYKCDHIRALEILRCIISINKQGK